MAGSVHEAKLLWSGGWDSSFHLVQLLLEYRVSVRPYYLIDPQRRSLRHEIVAMDRIREDLFRDHPFTRRLLKPTVFRELSAFPPDPSSMRALKDLQSRMFMGDQYGWMAGFCAHEGLGDLEMAVQGGGRMERLLRPFLMKVSEGPYETYRIRPGAKDPLAVLFRFYEFPIIDITKPETLDVARRRGWDRYLVHSWFCFHPAWDGRPCGSCLTCRIAAGQGMAWRIPLHRRWTGPVVARARDLLRPWLRPIWVRVKRGGSGRC